MIKKKLFGKKNSNFGNKWTEEQKNTLSIKKSGTIPPNRKFTKRQIFKILELRDKKISCRIISKKYNCHESVIKLISRGVTYKEIYKKYKNKKQ